MEGLSIWLSGTSNALETDLKVIVGVNEKTPLRIKGDAITCQPPLKRPPVNISVTKGNTPKLRVSVNTSVTTSRFIKLRVSVKPPPVRISITTYTPKLRVSIQRHHTNTPVTTGHMPTSYTPKLRVGVHRPVVSTYYLPFSKSPLFWSIQPISYPFSDRRNAIECRVNLILNIEIRIPLMSSNMVILLINGVGFGFRFGLD